MKKRKDRYIEVFRWKKHRFYVPQSPNELPTSRALGFWTAIREFTLHITFDDLEVMTRRLKQAINDSDLATAGYLVSTLEAYRQLDASKSTTFNVAQYYIFMDKEKGKLTEDWKEKKKELFDSSSEVQAFFLNITNGLLTALKILSDDIQIEDYLNREEVLEVEKIFSNSIQERFTSISKNQSMTSSLVSRRSSESSSMKRWKKSLSNFWRWR